MPENRRRDQPEAARHPPTSALVRLLEAGCLGLLTLHLALGLVALLTPPAVAPAHRRAGDLLALLALLLIAVGVASGLHRVAPGRWRAHVLLAAGSGATFLLRAAALPGPEGVAGRGHVGLTLGLSTPTPAEVAAVHAALGFLVGAAGAALAARVVRDGTWSRWGLLGAPAAALLLAWAQPRGQDLLPLAASMVAAPLPALALVPLEDVLGLRLALLAALCAVVALLALPAVDAPGRTPWGRRALVVACAAGLVASLLDAMLGVLVPPVASG